MNIEQKAKAYDRAIERAKEWYNNPNSSSIGKSYLYAVFPELKESEDEKIRNWCISHFKECVRVTKDNAEYQEYLNNKVIPWLEKQGESYTKRDVDDAYIEGMACAKNELEKQSEQKSTWSEENEKIRQTIINEFEQCSEWCCSNGLTKEDCINWLNKQKYFEWDDEDNENMNSLCVLLDQMVSINAIGNEHSIEYKNWLKSLKQRYTWKPSDEQMKVLEFFIPYVTKCSVVLQKSKDTLLSLLADLKKLREE